MVDFLSRREHSYAELVQKLMQRGYQKSDIIPALDRLVEKDWQSDERFTAAYIRYRSSKGFGPVRISQELKEKGVSSELIDHNILSNPELKVNWHENIKQVYSKKFSANLEKSALSFEELIKQKKYLRYRGFNQEQINFVMSDSQKTQEE